MISALLVLAVVAALAAVAGAALALALQFHQPLGGEADYLAQKVGVGALPNQFLKSDPVVGDRGLCSS
ncbi:hypothetical protein [Azospirillum sp. BE72]|uniref:hypothetical protein n=1 Tax=Azospirillum sp. BE72 TaxID=2817776 RepID=UPI002863C0D9|nr:hypothetical protein [Azospirillum sp. BE72]MDR6773269.1 hypothetical protein [Azospirillum sp. BE72]